MAEDKSLQNKISVLKKYRTVLDNSRIYFTYYHRKINKNLVFVESRNGRDIAGNILRLVLEIKNQFGNKYKICTAAREESMEYVKGILKAYSLDDIKVYKYESAAHYICLERAHYLINDSTFTTKYVKRDGQVYLNTWHGTPYKCMGRDSKSDILKMDNVQRNLLMADYLLFPSHYCVEKITEGYCVNGLYQGTVLDEGYPRNSIFFYKEIRTDTRKRFGFEGKKVYIYMPTYRESNAIHQDEKQIRQLYEFFDYIDCNLNNDEIFVVKLHYYVQEQMNFDKYKHIIVFPEGIETYEFLSACDCLITDYSSVFYDFANSGRKIIRFIYDEEEYLQNRGIYEQPVPFPFPEARTVEELLFKIRKPKGYDDKVFLDMYCPNESADAAKKIIRHVFTEEEVCSERSIRDDKEHILIYGGSFKLNGITKSLQNLMNMMKDDREYHICVCRNILEKPENEDNLNNIPGEKKIYIIGGNVHKTLSETIANILFYKKNINSKWIVAQRDKIYRRELKRSFYNTGFSTYIQFSGYDWEVTEIFERTTVNNCIYVHNDMIREIESGGNQHRALLSEAYSSYDKVAIVTEGLMESTEKLSGRKDNIILSENCQDFEAIIKRSNEIIKMDEGTEVICNDENVEIFLSKYNIKFITIGRFSAEKRHDRLIEAFELFCEDYSNAGLIIIGGYGEQYEKTLKRAEESSASKNIMIIKAMSNPMPLLKVCDLFILSSDYEGLPLVLLEANTLGVRQIATDISTVTDFMKKYNGTVVERSVEGVLEGMNMFMRGEIELLDIDYENYNKNRIEQFENIFL